MVFFFFFFLLQVSSLIFFKSFVAVPQRSDFIKVASYLIVEGIVPFSQQNQCLLHCVFSEGKHAHIQTHTHTRMEFSNFNPIASPCLLYCLLTCVSTLNLFYTRKPGQSKDTKLSFRFSSSVFSLPPLLIQIFREITFYHIFPYGVINPQPILLLFQHPDKTVLNKIPNGEFSFIDLPWT